MGEISSVPCSKCTKFRLLSHTDTVKWHLRGNCRNTSARFEHYRTRLSPDLCAGQ